MTQPFFSIITPSLNDAEHLEQAICSVMDQNLDDLQYMVVDGDSDDDTRELLELYSDDLDGWVSESDLGPADAVNKALAASVGEVICILPSHDVYLPGTLLAIERYFKSGADWVVGQVIKPASDNEPQQVSADMLSSLTEALLLESEVLSASAMFFRRRLFERFGLFDRSLRFGWLHEYTARLIAGGMKPFVRNERYAVHRRSSVATGEVANQVGRDHAVLLHRYLTCLPSEQQEMVRQRIDQRQRHRAAYVALEQGQTGRRLLVEQLIQHPWWMEDPIVQRALHKPTHPEMLAAA